MILKFTEKAVRTALVYAQHDERRTVTTDDVLQALKRQGVILYGFGTPAGISHRPRSESNIGDIDDMSRSFSIDEDEDDETIEYERSQSGQEEWAGDSYDDE